MRWVSVDHPVLDRDLEDGRQCCERFVDRGWSKSPLLELRDPVAVDVLDRDLVEAPRRKRWKKVPRQAPFQVLLALASHASARTASLDELPLKPLAGEVLKRRQGPWFGSDCSSREHAVTLSDAMCEKIRTSARAVKAPSENVMCVH
jgi:hypothetical protein